MAVENLKLERPLAVIDLESTGVDPRADRVVEVAVVKVFPDRTVATYHRRINPGIAIPEAASRVHGIVDADVVDAPSFSQIAGDLLEVFAESDLAGFGLATFDLPLLAAEFARTGRSFLVANRKVLDALAIYWRYHPRDLASAVRYYLGREHDQAHRAVSDAQAALEILDRQIAVHGLPVKPEHLHETFVEVDVSRRFRRDAHREIVFAFGKHLGKRVRDVARSDPSYLEWMRNQPFLDDTRKCLEEALRPVE